MVTLGLLQYLAPILQFALGVLVVRRGRCRPAAGSASSWSGSRWRVFTVEASHATGAGQLRLAAEVGRALSGDVRV